MRRYTYIAIDPRGGRVSGEIEASDPDAVVSQLTARGLRIESVQTSLEQSGGGGSEPARPSGLSPEETREMGTHISEIILAGLPLEAGLAAVAEEFPRGRLRRSLRAMVRDLESGRDLESVLNSHHAAAYLPALVRAGQRSGRTGEILENFIASTQVASELRATLWMALAYPFVLILTLAAVLLFLQICVIPQFSAIVSSFGITLPVLSSAMFATSEFMAAHGGSALLVFAGAVVFLVVSFRLILGEVSTRRLLCRIPVFGQLLRWSALSRFSPLLSVLIEGRVPLDQAVVLAGDASGDAEIRDDCRKLAASLQAGNTLEQAAQETGRFPASFMRALTWERCHEGFPDVLRSMADLYAGRARALVMLLAVLVPPLVFVFVVGIVGTVVVLLFWPLIELLNKLS